MFYVGITIGVMFLPRASDMYGRLPLGFLTLFFQLGAQIGLLYSTKITHTYIYEFLIGVSCAGVHVIFPNYLNEILPSQKAREITTSMQNLIYDAFIIPLAFYY